MKVSFEKQSGLSSVLVDCMRRSGKVNEHCFVWTRKYLSWYHVNDVIALVSCNGIPGQK